MKEEKIFLIDGRFGNTYIMLVTDTNVYKDFFEKDRTDTFFSGYVLDSTNKLMQIGDKITFSVTVKKELLRIILTSVFAKHVKLLDTIQYPSWWDKVKAYKKNWFDTNQELYVSEAPTSSEPEDN